MVGVIEFLRRKYFCFMNMHGVPEPKYSMFNKQTTILLDNIFFLNVYTKICETFFLSKHNQTNTF